MFYKLYGEICKNSSINSTFFHNSRKYSETQTHYEVLNLPQDCSEKEIKAAFIKLSKEHHPDVNKRNKSHAKFLRINEAYKTLGKAESRRNYDLGLAVTRERVNKENLYQRNPYADPTFWRNRDKKQDQFYKSKTYYGIKGVKRVSNLTVVLVCFALTSIGIGLQLLAITKSFTFHREDLIRKSIEAQRSLDQTKQVALDNGNDLQVEILKVKLLGGIGTKGSWCYRTTNV